MNNIKLEIKDYLKNDQVHAKIKIEGKIEDVRKTIKQLAETF